MSTYFSTLIAMGAHMPPAGAMMTTTEADLTLEQELTMSYGVEVEGLPPAPPVFSHKWHSRNDRQATR